MAPVKNKTEIDDDKRSSNMFDLMGDGIDMLQSSHFASSWLGGMKNQQSQKVIPKITNI